jgi:hypothetical protein
MWSIWGYLAAMPRHFFRICDDFDSPDDLGKDLPDLVAAMDYAVAGARSLVAETVHEGDIVCHHRVDILDEAGAVLHAVRFDDAIIIRP